MKISSKKILRNKKKMQNYGKCMYNKHFMVHMHGAYHGTALASYQRRYEIINIPRDFLHTNAHRPASSGSWPYMVAVLKLKWWDPQGITSSSSLVLNTSHNHTCFMWGSPGFTLEYHCRTLLCKAYRNKNDDTAFLFVHVILSYLLWLATWKVLSFIVLAPYSFMMMMMMMMGASLPWLHQLTTVLSTCSHGHNMHVSNHFKCSYSRGTDSGSLHAQGWSEAMDVFIYSTDIVS